MLSRSGFWLLDHSKSRIEMHFVVLSFSVSFVFLVCVSFVSSFLRFRFCSWPSGCVSSPFSKHFPLRLVRFWFVFVLVVLSFCFLFGLCVPLSCSIIAFLSLLFSFSLLMLPVRYVETMYLQYALKTTKRNGFLTIGIACCAWWCCVSFSSVSMFVLYSLPSSFLIS